MTRKRVPILLACCLLLVLPMLMGAASSRSYVSSNYMLELDGEKTGWIKSVSGGKVYAEVVNEAVGTDYFVHKHISAPKYSDFEMQVGFSMSKSVYDWIASSWKQSYARKDGSIIVADYNLKANSQRQFYHALLTEVTIPAMDGSSKEPAYLTIKFAPEYIRNAKVSDAKSTMEGAAKGEQKTWLPSNFKLEIDGLNTSKVNKIDAFTVKQSAVQDDIGDARDQQREPGKLEFPNLKITLAAASVDDWQNWLDDFIVKGNNGQANEKNGKITLLANDRKTELATIKLFNMGIISLEALDSESGSDAIQRYQAELYVERMEFEGPSPTK